MFVILNNFCALKTEKGGKMCNPKRGKVDTIVQKHLDKITLPRQMHPSCLKVGEYGVITKSLYDKLVGTLVISIWRKKGVEIVSLEAGSSWYFDSKINHSSNFRVRKVVVDKINCRYVISQKRA